MSKIRIEKVEDGFEEAQRLADEEEGIGRKPDGWQKYLIPTIAIAWSLFQLSLPKWLLIDSTYIRAIHLGFAITLVFLNYPLLKKPYLGLKYFAEHKKIPLLDIALALFAAYCALYLMLNYEELVTRYGTPSTMDRIIGLSLVEDVAVQRAGIIIIIIEKIKKRLFISNLLFYRDAVLNDYRCIELALHFIHDTFFKKKRVTSDGSIAR